MEKISYLGGPNEFVSNLELAQRYRLAEEVAEGAICAMRAIIDELQVRGVSEAPPENAA